VTTGAGHRFGRVPALDGLRGLAVLLVVALHAGLLIEPARGGLLPGGFVGVDVFFVLSGFLITSLLVGEHADTGRISFARFYARRGWRLLPALVVLLLAHAAYAAWADIPRGTEVRSIAAIVLYVSNWAQSYGLDVPGGLIHTWTLAIEEQFYLVWPAAVLLMLRHLRTRRAILTVLVVAIAASATLRAWIWAFGAGYPAAYMRTDARADGLLIGAACAFLWHWDLVPRRGVAGAATLSLISVIAFSVLWDSSSPAMFYGGFTVVSLAAGAMIIGVMQGGWRAGALFEVPILRGIGRVSYGLYLWQGLALHVAARVLHDEPRVLQALVGVGMAALATFLSWRLVEQPLLRRRDRVPVPVVERLALDLG
jgi:peptidoglycan/LPS O-acetylase OafA/YrhL